MPPFQKCSKSPLGTSFTACQALSGKFVTVYFIKHGLLCWKFDISLGPYFVLLKMIKNEEFEIGRYIYMYSNAGCLQGRKK
jgi:hypothetical protein